MGGIITTTIKRNHFKIYQKIGKGEFGEVLLVKNRYNNKYYAAKEINLLKVFDSGVKPIMIKNELNALKRLEKHQFLTELSFSFIENEFCYIVLDLLNGGTLRDLLLIKYTFTERQISFLIACIASGISYIHEKGIIHRDIKPENIVLDWKGFPHIADFGISHVDPYYPNNLAPISCRMTSGTEQYCAPECLAAPHDHGIEVDYWSLGIMTFELYFLMRPFKKRVPKQCVRYVESLRRTKNSNDDLLGAGFHTDPHANVYFPKELQPLDMNLKLNNNNNNNNTYNNCIHNSNNNNNIIISNKESKSKFNLKNIGLNLRNILNKSFYNKNYVQPITQLNPDDIHNYNNNSSYNNERDRYVPSVSTKFSRVESEGHSMSFSFAFMHNKSNKVAVCSNNNGNNNNNGNGNGNNSIYSMNSSFHGSMYGSIHGNDSLRFGNSSDLRSYYGGSHYDQNRSHYESNRSNNHFEEKKSSHIAAVEPKIEKQIEELVLNNANLSQITKQTAENSATGSFTGDKVFNQFTESRLGNHLVSDLSGGSIHNIFQQINHQHQVNNNNHGVVNIANITNNITNNNNNNNNILQPNYQSDENVCLKCGDSIPIALTIPMPSTQYYSYTKKEKPSNALVSFLNMLLDIRPDHRLGYKATNCLPSITEHVWFIEQNIPIHEIFSSPTSLTTTVKLDSLPTIQTNGTEVPINLIEDNRYQFNLVKSMKGLVKNQKLVDLCAEIGDYSYISPDYHT